MCSSIPSLNNPSSRSLILFPYLTFTAFDLDAVSQMRRVRCDLSDVVHRVLDDLGYQIIAKRIRIQEKSRKVNVLSDPVFLERILENVLSNAVKYSREHSVIRVGRPAC